MPDPSSRWLHPPGFSDENMSTAGGVAATINMLGRHEFPSWMRERQHVPGRPQAVTRRFGGIVAARRMGCGHRKRKTAVS